MYIPSDPNMLLSVINTQLRDNYSSLEDLCASCDLDTTDIVTKLEEIGYIYNPDLNQFR